MGRASLAEVGSWRVAEALSFGIPNSGRPCPMVGTRNIQIILLFLLRHHLENCLILQKRVLSFCVVVWRAWFHEGWSLGAAGGLLP